MARSRGSAAPDDRVFIGIVYVRIRVPGARTLKDRRTVVSSVSDRLRHRYGISVHEIGQGSDATRQTIVLTTAGNDASVVRSVIDQCVGQVQSHPVAIAEQVDTDVFRWEPSQDDWAARMMAELGSDAGDDDA